MLRGEQQQQAPSRSLYIYMEREGGLKLHCDVKQFENGAHIQFKVTEERGHGKNTRPSRECTLTCNYANISCDNV